MSTGCGSYAARPLSPPEFEAMPVRYSLEGIRLGADPYARAERQTAAFDVELGRCGVLPVRLLVQNTTARPLWVRASEVRLDFSDGTRAFALDVFTVGRCGSAVATGEQPPIIVAPTHPMWGLGPRVGATAGLVGAAIGVASLAAAEARVRDPHLAHYQQIEFRGALLREQDSTHGFIFFYLPEDKRAFDTVELVVPLNDPADESSFALRLPLGGLTLGDSSPAATQEDHNTEKTQ